MDGSMHIGDKIFGFPLSLGSQSDNLHQEREEDQGQKPAYLPVTTSPMLAQARVASPRKKGSLKLGFYKNKTLIGVAIEGLGQLEAFDKLTSNKGAAIVKYFFHMMTPSGAYNIQFSGQAQRMATAIANKGGVPFIAIEPRAPGEKSGSRAAPYIPFKEIRKQLEAKSGPIYQGLRTMFIQMRDWQRKTGSPLVLSFRHEPNLPKSRPDRYPNSGEPENFTAIWDLLWELADEVGAAKNITWMPCYNDTPANYEDYLPNPKHVDAFAIHAYNDVAHSPGTQTPYQIFNGPYRLLGRIIPKRKGFKPKPVIIAETGHDRNRPGKNRWLTQLFEYIKGTRIKGFIYFNLNKSQTVLGKSRRFKWAIEDPESIPDKTSDLYKEFKEIRDAFVQGMADPHFVGRKAVGKQKAAVLDRIGTVTDVDFKIPEEKEGINLTDIKFTTILEWLKIKMARFRQYLKQEDLDSEFRDEIHKLMKLDIYEEDLISEEFNYFLWRWLIKYNEKGYCSWTLKPDKYGVHEREKGFFVEETYAWNKFEALYKICILKLASAAALLPSVPLQEPNQDDWAYTEKLAKLQIKKNPYLYISLAQTQMGWGEGIAWRVKGNAPVGKKLKAYQATLSHLLKAAQYAKLARKEDLKYTNKAFSATALLARIYQDIGNTFLYMGWAKEQLWKDTNNPKHYLDAETYKRRALANYQVALKYARESVWDYDRLREYLLNLAVIQTLSSMEAFSYPMRNKAERSTLGRKIPSYKKVKIRGKTFSLKLGVSVDTLVAELDKMIEAVRPYIPLSDKLSVDINTVIDPARPDKKGRASRYDIEAVDSAEVIVAAFRIDVQNILRGLYEQKIALLKWKLEESPLDKKAKTELEQAIWELKKGPFDAKSKKVVGDAFRTDFEINRKKALRVLNPKGRLSLVRSIHLASGNIDLTLAEEIVKVLNHARGKYKAATVEGYAIPNLYTGFTEANARLYFILREKLGPQHTTVQEYRKKAADFRKKSHTHGDTYDALRADIWYAKVEMTEAGEDPNSIRQREKLEELYQKILLPASRRIQGYEHEDLKRTLAENFGRRAFIAKDLGDYKEYMRLLREAMPLLASAVQYPDYARKETSGEALVWQAKILMAVAGDIDDIPEARELIAKYLGLNKSRLKGPKGEKLILERIRSGILADAAKRVKHKSKYEVMKMQGESLARIAFLEKGLKDKAYKVHLAQAEKIFKQVLEKDKAGEWKARRVTRGEAGHWLAKVAIVLVGDMEIGDEWKGKTIYSDAQLVAAQLERIKEAEDYIDQAVPLLVGKAKLDLESTRSEIYLIQAYLSKDTGKLADFRSSSQKAFQALAAVIKPGRPEDPYAAGVSTVYGSYLSLASYLSAIAGSKPEARAAFRILKTNFPQFNFDFDPDAHQTEIENYLLVQAQGLLHKALEAETDKVKLTGRARIAAIKLMIEVYLRQAYLFRDLVAKRLLPQDPEKFKEAVENLKLFVTDEERLIIEQGDPNKLKALMAQYIKKFNEIIEDGQATLKEIVMASERAELAEEGSTVYYQSILATVSDINDLNKEKEIIQKQVVIPLRKLLANPSLKGRARVAAWGTLGEAVKTVGSISRDLDGYSWDPQRLTRKSVYGDKLLQEARDILSNQVVASARLDLAEEARASIGDTLAIQAGEEMRPEKEIKILIDSRKDYLLPAFERRFDPLDPGKPEATPYIIQGRSRFLMKQQRADTEMRLGFLWRQIEGRDSPRGKEHLDKARELYQEILASKRGDLVEQTELNLALMDYVQAADKNADPKQDGRIQRLELGKLERVFSQILALTRSNRLTGRARENVVKFMAELKGRLAMIIRDIEGKDSSRAKGLIDEARALIALVRASGIKEFGAEIQLLEIRLDLVLAADSERDPEELKRIEEIIPVIDAFLDAKGEITDANLSSRAQIDLFNLLIEAFARKGFLWRDLHAKGGKKNIERLYQLVEKTLKDRIELKKERQKIIREGGDKKRLAQIDQRLEQIKANLQANLLRDYIKEIKESMADPQKRLDETANYYLAVALEKVVDKVLFSGRMDLEAVGDFWVGQILSVMAEDDLEMLDLAEEYMRVAFESDELRGIQVVDAHIGIGKILARKAGIRNEQPFRIAWFLAGEAIEHLQKSIAIIGDRANLTPRQRKDFEDARNNLEKLADRFVNIIRHPEGGQQIIPKEQEKKMADVLIEIADVLSWGRWDLYKAFDYYNFALELMEKTQERYDREGIPIDNKMKKALARVHIGLAEMRRYIGPWMIDYDLSFKHFKTALDYLEIKIDKKTGVVSENGKLGEGETAISTSILTQVAKAYLGLGNLYAVQDWPHGDEKLAEDYFERCERILKEIKAKGAPKAEFDKYLKLDLDDIEEIGTWTAEHKQIQRMLIRSRQNYSRIYKPQATLFFNAQENEYGLNLKLEYPFKLYKELYMRVILENELKQALGTKAWKPILALAWHWGRHDIGSFDWGFGFPVKMLLGDPTELRADLSYNFRNMASLFASYRLLDLGLDSQSVYTEFQIRPFYLIRSLIPRLRSDVPSLIRNILNSPYAQGISAGISMTFWNDIFGERNRSGESIVFSPEAKDGVQKWAYNLYLNLSWDLKFFLDWVGVSTRLGIPLDGRYVRGIMLPGEKDLVKEDAPYRWHGEINITPTWKIFGGYPSFGIYADTEFRNFDDLIDLRFLHLSGGGYLRWNF